MDDRERQPLGWPFFAFMAVATIVIGVIAVTSIRWMTAPGNTTSCTITARTRSSVVLLMEDGHCKVMP